MCLMFLGQYITTITKVKVTLVTWHGQGHTADAVLYQQIIAGLQDGRSLTNSTLRNITTTRFSHIDHQPQGGGLNTPGAEATPLS